MGRSQDGLLLTFENRSKCEIMYKSIMPDLFGGEYKEYAEWEKKYDRAMTKACEEDKILNYGEDND